MSEKQIIGLTGFARSGKSVAVEHLASSHGFVVVKASDMIRQELVAETGRANFSREELRARGTAIKNRLGPDFLIEYCLGLEAENIALDGVRNYTAAKRLQAEGGTMIGLVARPEVRFAREQTASDHKLHNLTVEAMMKEEQPEMNSLDRNGMHLLRILWTMPAANIVDTSDLTIPQVCEAVDAIIEAA